MHVGTRKPIALLLVLVLVGALAFGCTPKTEEDAGAKADEPVAGGRMTWYLSEPKLIDPVNTSESEGIQVVSALNDGLVTFDPLTSEIEPAIAESWEPNDDGSVWTFKLREGVKFHDGTEVKAADFKYAWERICDPANASEISYHLSAIKGYDEMQAEKNPAKELSGVVAKDDYTLEVTLQYPFSDFPYVTGHPSLGPVPKALVEKDPKAFAEAPVLAGPFKMAEPWKHEQYIKVDRFEDYYGDKPYLDGVDFMIFKDENTAFLEFQQGNLDFTTIPSGQIQATAEKYGESGDGYTVEAGKQCLFGPELSTYFIWLNTKDKTLSNPDVRRAVSLAINRQAIIDSVYEGTREPASGPVPPGIVGYQDGAWQYSKYDKAQAEELLAKAGFPGGKGLPEIKLHFNTGVGHEKVMQLVQADLKAVGINAVLDGHPWDQYSGWVYENKPNLQMARMGWLADYPIMDNFLYPLFNSKAGDNLAQYNNPEVDKLMEEARATTNEDERVAKYQEVEKLIGEDMPLVPVVGYSHLRVGSDRINGFVFDAMGLGHPETTWLKDGGAGSTSDSETTE